MDQNITFLTGLGCGVCLGVSLIAFKKYVGVFSKISAASKAQGVAAAKKFSINNAVNEYRLVLVVRSDLQMSKGNVATQCGHASVMAFEQALEKDPEGTAFWLSIGQTKIALKADSLDELKRLEDKAKEMGVLTSMVCDEGRTQVAPNTVTVLGIGPAPQDTVKLITGHLKLL